MADIEGDIVIARPVAEVFDFVADERNEPRYNPRMLRVEQVSPEPLGAGTRFRAEVARGRGVSSITIEFTAFERHRRLASRSELSVMDVEGALTFEPVPAGTRLRWCWRVSPRGLLRFVKPLMVWIGRRQEQAVWGDLKRLLETGAVRSRRLPGPSQGDGLGARRIP